MNWRNSYAVKEEAMLPEFAQEDTGPTFFKCIRWQVEATLDPINCPFHYFCDSIYPGNYPKNIDILVILFTTATFLATLFIMVIEMYRRQPLRHQVKRYIIPSGSISLPIILLVFAKGHRIDTIFPISQIGPAILQLVYISALTFKVGFEKNNIKYAAFFEASTVSGILQASLYLDSVILPYYTGLDALVSSTFSGECPSCVCRKDVLVVGGAIMRYRGWSKTTFSVVGALSLRIICRLPGWKTRKIEMFEKIMEGLCWILISLDCLYLTMSSPSPSSFFPVAAFGGVYVLICLCFLKWSCAQIAQFHLMSSTTNGIEKI